MEVADSFAGGVCKCDACGAVLTVPDEPTQSTPTPADTARPARPDRPDAPPAPPKQRPDAPPAPPKSSQSRTPVVPGRQPGGARSPGGTTRIDIPAATTGAFTTTSRARTGVRKRKKPTALYAFAALILVTIIFIVGVLLLAMQMSDDNGANLAALDIDNEPDTARISRPTISSPAPRDTPETKPDSKPAPTVTPAGPATLFAHWPLDGDYNDRGPHGLHGKPHGDPTFTSGAVGQAVDFDGDDRVEIAYDPALDTLLEGVSISVWVKLPPDTKQQMWTGIVNQGDSSWRISLIMDNPGQLHFAINRGQGKDRIDSKRKDYNDGKWHHVVGIYARSESHLYIDGKRIATNHNPAKSIKKTKLPVWIGDNSERKWAIVGAIDDVRIYKGALTEAEVKQLHEQGK